MKSLKKKTETNSKKGRTILKEHLHLAQRTQHFDMLSIIAGYFLPFQMPKHSEQTRCESLVREQN